MNGLLFKLAITNLQVRAVIELKNYTEIKSARQTEKKTTTMLIRSNKKKKSILCAKLLYSRELFQFAKSFVETLSERKKNNNIKL